MNDPVGKIGPRLDTLAGRVGLVDLPGFRLGEVGGDLLLIADGKRYGFEFKYADAPGTTRSMRVAMRNLNLAHLWIVYPGAEAYDLDDRISVLPASDVPRISLSRLVSPR